MEPMASEFKLIDEYIDYIELYLYYYKANGYKTPVNNKYNIINFDFRKIYNSFTIEKGNILTVGFYLKKLTKTYNDLNDVHNITYDHFSQNEETIGMVDSDKWVNQEIYHLEHSNFEMELIINTDSLLKKIKEKYDYIELAINSPLNSNYENPITEIKSKLPSQIEKQELFTNYIHKIEKEKVNLFAELLKDNFAGIGKKPVAVMIYVLNRDGYIKLPNEGRKPIYDSLRALFVSDIGSNSNLNATILAIEKTGNLLSKSIHQKDIDKCEIKIKNIIAEIGK
jgi:hypothetical protein